MLDHLKSMLDRFRDCVFSAPVRLLQKPSNPKWNETFQQDFTENTIQNALIILSKFPSETLEQMLDPTFDFKKLYKIYEESVGGGPGFFFS